MLWFIYFLLAIGTSAWAWVTGDCVPLVVVCAAVIVTVILESAQPQNATPPQPPITNVDDYPVIHRGGETWIPYVPNIEDTPWAKKD